MSRRHSVTRTAALIAAAGLAAVAGHAGLKPAGPATIRPVEVGAQVPTFPVKGAPVTGLFPGSTKTIAVSVQNPFTFSIKVTSLVLSVKPATSAGACAGSAANLTVKLGSGLPVTVKAKKTAELTATVTMPATAANACQGGTFTLAESAKAVRA